MALNAKQAKGFFGNCKAFHIRHTARARSRQSVAPRAERSGTWLPGITAPDWLDGSLPADRGYAHVLAVQVLSTEYEHVWPLGYKRSIPAPLA